MLAVAKTVRRNMTIMKTIICPWFIRRIAIRRRNRRRSARILHTPRMTLQTLFEGHLSGGWALKKLSKFELINSNGVFNFYYLSVQKLR